MIRAVVACTLAVLLVAVALSPRPVRGDAVVGMGTADSCTEAAFDATVTAGGNLTFNCGSSPVIITVTSPTTITANTSIDGGGIITLSGGGTTQLFNVNQRATLALANLTVTGGAGAISNAGTLNVSKCTFSGNSAYDGGAIYNRGGTLMVADSTFSGNNAGSGGAILNLGTLIVTDSTFFGNSAFNGGAIYSDGTLMVTGSTFSNNGGSYYTAGGGILNMGTLTVTDSTFSSNRASGGGGIYNDGGVLTVTNSTLSGNRAKDSLFGGGVGGGIFSVGVLTVTNSTFWANSAGLVGGSLFTGRVTATLINTIIANSTSGGNCSDSVTDGGHNIDDGTTCGFAGAGCTSTSGSSVCNANPHLDPAGLANNGGPTQTIALQAGSPAINAGDLSVCPDLDQRGYVRPGRGATRCSIGAYEFNSPSACTGDCERDGHVTVDDILTMVNIAFGIAEGWECARGDANKDGQITVDEVLKAVNNVLNGCPT